MSFNSCCKFLIAPIWPIVSIVFGIILGTFSSAITTLIVILIGLCYLPFHLWQTLSVAATTEDFFKLTQGNFIWRPPVFLLTPIGPLLFLVGFTVLSATFGTLFQIGIATGIVYDHEYEKAAKSIRANLRFGEDSIFGGFVDICETVVNKDDFALATIGSIKTILTTVVALGFACLAFVPFAVTMALVTVIRLPINFFKTTKIALFTVMLRWDLRIIALFMLPLVHTLFPVIVLVVSMIGSFFWTWAQVQENLFEDANPFREWYQLIDTVEDYYEEHKKFVSNRCDPFDHPTGIPMGWNGQQYGLEIERIVRFQLNFLLCVALLLYQTPVILAGTAVIVLVKFLPSCIYLWLLYSRSCICDPESNCFIVLSVWPFHVLAVALIPVGSALFGIGFMLWALLEGYCDVVQMIFKLHAPLCECISVPFVWIRRCDVYTAKYYVMDKDLRFVTKLCCPCSKRSNGDDNGLPRRQRSSSSRGETLNADIYWDRFASQCIQSTADLLAQGFLDFDSVEGMDSACMQSIPAVAVYTILMDSLQTEGLKKGDIYWRLDEVVCAAKGRAPLDNIGTLVWPMVLDLQAFMKKNKKALLKQKDDPEVTMAIEALLCDNHEADESTDAIKKVLDAISAKQKALNNQLRTKISRLVLVILRVRPFQNRMDKIFQHKYDNPTKRMDDLEAQPLDAKAKGEDAEKNAPSILDRLFRRNSKQGKRTSRLDRIFGRKSDASNEPNGEATEAADMGRSSVFDRVFGGSNQKSDTANETATKTDRNREGGEAIGEDPSIFYRIFGLNKADDRISEAAVEEDPNLVGAAQVEVAQKDPSILDRVLGRNKADSQRVEMIDSDANGEGAEVQEKDPSIFDRIFGRN